MSRPDLVALAALAVLLLTGCGDGTAPSPAGAWGGTEASMVLGPAGGTIQYPCGNGTIASGWTVDRAGTFSATGTHANGGGPVPPEGWPTHPARYEGRVAGDSFVFTVTLTDLDQRLGPFHLRRDGPPVTLMCV